MNIDTQKKQQQQKLGKFTTSGNYGISNTDVTSSQHDTHINKYCSCYILYCILNN